MSNLPAFNWREHVGGYPIEKENREYLAATSTVPVVRSFGDLPEIVDIRLHPLFGQGFMQVENQGSIGSCFPPGVDVTMANGSRKFIEDVQVGDVVLSQKQLPRKVTHTMTRQFTGNLYEFQVDKWGRLKMTDDHVVPVSRGTQLLWVKASEVLESDMLNIISDGSSRWRRIKEIHVAAVEDFTVHDITVEEDHSFIADGVGVHNCQGQSLTENAEFCFTQVTGQVIQYSRMFAYIISQMANNIRTDSGSTLEGGTKAARDVGFCPENLAPYPSRYPGWSWVTQAMKDAAAPHKLRSHTSIKAEPEVKSYIGSGLGIVQIGIMWNGSMEPDQFGCIRRWSAGGGGGHAVVLCGYTTDAVVGQRSSRGYWYILKNSWGKRWGLDGFCYVDPEAVMQMLTHQWSVFIGRSDMSAPRPRPINIDFTKTSKHG